mmetsp:Transcript_42286/g.111318  ORF Transcript_42286/g.111318 Transcript_42286/m.111318 type:complete len:205 (-) Transcript_42286:5950-6564(-)
MSPTFSSKRELSDSKALTTASLSDQSALAPTHPSRRVRQSAWAREASAALSCLTRASCSSRRRTRQKKYSRARCHGTMSEMTPLASMRPGRSCRSANSWEICTYSGISCASRAAIVRLRAATSSSATSASSAAASSASSVISFESRRCIVFTRSGLRNLTSQMPGGSRMPPRAFVSTYISIISSLMVGSTTTHAPPRSSPLGGM